MDVICLEDDVEMSEACTVQVLSDDESEDLLPDYPVPSVRKIALGQSVNAPRENVVAPDVSAMKGKRKVEHLHCAVPAAIRVLNCNVCASYLVYQLSSSDRDQLEAKRMEKRAQQAAERAQKRMHKEMEKRLKQVAISYTCELSCRYNRYTHTCGCSVGGERREARGNVWRAPEGTAVGWRW